MSTQNVYLGMNAVIRVDGQTFGNVRDVTLNLSRSSADVTTRSNDGWRAQVGTLREGSVSFQMYKLEGDDNEDKVINAFLAAGEGSLIGAAILDSVEGDGPCGLWSVTSCNRGEALEEAVSYDVELQLTKFYGWIVGGVAPGGSDYSAEIGVIIGSWG